MHTAEWNFSDFVIEYLARSKPNSKILEFFLSQNTCQKSRDTVPLRHHRKNNFKTLDQNRHLVTYWLCVRCTLRSLTWRWDARRAVFLDTLFSRQSLTLLYGAHLRVWLRGMMQTAETDYCVWYDAHCRVSKKIRISRRNRNRIWKDLCKICLSEAQMGSNKKV